MKDNNSSCLTLRKIDAIKRINLEQVNKSPLDIQLEMLENNIAESENKKNIGSIEEMKRDINGGIITGKLPTFSIEYEEIGGSIKQKIQRIDSDHVSPNHGLSNRDILPNKDLKDIVEDMLNVPFKPQPYMIETMK